MTHYSLPSPLRSYLLKFKQMYLSNGNHQLTSITKKGKEQYSCLSDQDKQIKLTSVSLKFPIKITHRVFSGFSKSFPHENMHINKGNRIWANLDWKAQCDTYPCPIFSSFVYFLLGSPTETIVLSFSSISSSVIFLFRLSVFGSVGCSNGLVYCRKRETNLKPIQRDSAIHSFISTLNSFKLNHEIFQADGHIIKC